MNQIIAVATIAICFSGAARAGDLDYFCQELGFSSEFIMNFRQDDTAMSLVVQMLGNDGKDQMTIDMVVRAYEQPLLDTVAEKVAAVSAFRNEVELECFQMIARPGAEATVRQAIADMQS